MSRCPTGSVRTTGRTTTITACCSAGKTAGRRTLTPSPDGSSSWPPRPACLEVDLHDVRHSHATAGRDAKITDKAMRPARTQTSQAPSSPRRASRPAGGSWPACCPSGSPSPGTAHQMPPAVPVVAGHRTGTRQHRQGRRHHLPSRADHLCRRAHTARGMPRCPPGRRRHFLTGPACANDTKEENRARPVEPAPAPPGRYPG